MIRERMHELISYMDVLGLKPISIRLTQSDIDLFVQEAYLITNQDPPKITLRSNSKYMGIDVKPTGNPISYMMGKPEDRRLSIKLLSLETKEEIF